MGERYGSVKQQGTYGSLSERISRRLEPRESTVGTEPEPPLDPIREANERYVDRVDALAKTYKK